eukprot:GHVP01017009.1.p1 GENE.GHVP01017009.1~~GHVP01017009.1.p1  ORF type:complete len:383 (-),score=69.74 GHVP01017009.1:460-1608(-)
MANLPNFDMFRIPSTGISDVNQEIPHLPLLESEIPDELDRDSPHSANFLTESQSSVQAAAAVPAQGYDIISDLFGPDAKQEKIPPSSYFKILDDLNQVGSQSKSLLQAPGGKRKNSEPAEGAKKKFTQESFPEASCSKGASAFSSESVECQDSVNSVTGPKPFRSHFLPEWEVPDQGQLGGARESLFEAPGVFKKSIDFYAFQNVEKKYTSTAGWHALYRLFNDSRRKFLKTLDDNWKLEFRVVDVVRKFEIQRNLLERPPRLVWGNGFNPFLIYPFKEDGKLVDDYYCLGFENVFVRFGKNNIYVETTREETKKYWKEELNTKVNKALLEEYKEDNGIEAESGIVYYPFGYGHSIDPNYSPKFLLRDSVWKTSTKPRLQLL